MPLSAVIFIINKENPLFFNDNDFSLSTAVRSG